MEEHEQATEKAKQARQTEEHDQLKSNKISAQALDHSLQSVGLSLEMFRWRCDTARPLAAGESRHSLSREQFPQGFSDPDRRRRSCIVDKQGNRRLEVPRIPSPPKQLHLILDRGPCSWHMPFWLFSKMRIDGTFWADPNHQIWTSTQLALKESGYWCTFLEISLLCSVKGGPWEGSAFLNVIQEATEEYFTLVDSDADELLRFLEEPLSEELGMNQPGIVGSEEGFQRLRALVRSKLLSLKKGPKVKLARWFSYFDCADDMEGHWALHLFIMLYIGLRSRWWASLSETPLFKGRQLSAVQQDALEEPPQASSASSTTAPRTMKACNHELKQLKASCKNQLHVAAHLLCSLGTRSMMKMLNIAAALVRLDFGRMTVAHKSREGGRQWMLSMCAGGGRALLSELFSTVHDPKVPDCMRFSSSVCGDDRQTAQADELYLCERYLDLVRSLAKQRVLFVGLYEWALPAKLAALASSDQELVKSTLEWLQDLWHALEALESSSSHNKFAKGYLDELVWPAMPFVRNIMVGLWECEFSRVPPDIHEQVLAMSRGFRTTKAIEDAFNLGRDKEALSKRGGLVPRTMWHFLQSSQIAADCDRPQVVVSQAAQNLAGSQVSQKALPSAMFMGEAGTFSLGDDSWDSLTKNRDWTSLGPLSYLVMGFGTACLVASSGDVDLLEACWQSLIMVPGSVVKKASQHELFFVVHATHTCAFLWKLRHATACGSLVLDFGSSSDRDLFRMELVSDYAGWMAIAVSVLPPKLGAKHQAQLGKTPNSMVFVLDGRAEALVQYAARRAFTGLTVFYLNKLYTSARVKSAGSRPTTELPLTRALVQHFLPKLSADEVNTIVQLRKKKVQKEPSDSILLDMQSMTAANDLLDDDTKLALSKWQQSHGLHSSVAEKADGNMSVTKVGVACPGSSTSSSSRPKVSLTGASTPAWARDLLPQGIVGCGIKRDDVRHMRWQTYYPSPEPPRSWSRCWGAQCSSAEALHFVLAACWASHTAATGEQCPYDFALE